MILSSGKRAINTDHVFAVSLEEATVIYSDERSNGTAQVIELVTPAGHTYYIAPVPGVYPNKLIKHGANINSAEADPLLFADLLSFYFSDR
jgi:hypothetical protein